MCIYICGYIYAYISIYIYTYIYNLHIMCICTDTVYIDRMWDEE